MLLSRLARIPVLVALALLATACASTTGGTPPARDPVAVKKEEGEAAALFARAQALRAEERWDAARGFYRDLFEDYPGSPLAPEAQFQAADCAYKAGRLFAAGEQFCKYIEDRPHSARILEVEQRLYDSGCRMIQEGKGGLWGMGIFSTSEEGVSLLRRMVALLPSGTWADDALLEAGRWYWSEKDFPACEAVLEELLKNYSGSEWRYAARFLAASAYRKDNRGPAYDGEKLRRARAHFEAYVHAFDGDPVRSEEYAEPIAASKAEVEAIDADLARKALLRARLYRRTGKETAALTVLQEAARRWGATDPGRECAEQAVSLAADLGIAPAEPAAPAAPEEPK